MNPISCSMRSITACRLRTRSTTGMPRRATADRGELKSSMGQPMNSVSPLWPVGEPWQLPMPDGTLYHALARAAHQRPRHPPTAFYGATLSYAELRQPVHAMPALLHHVCRSKPGNPPSL